MGTVLRGWGRFSSAENRPHLRKKAAAPAAAFLFLQLFRNHKLRRIDRLLH